MSSRARKWVQVSPSDPIKHRWEEMVFQFSFQSQGLQTHNDFEEPAHSSTPSKHDNHLYQMKISFLLN